MRRIPRKKPNILQITSTTGEQIKHPVREIVRHNPAYGIIVTEKSPRGVIKYESSLERDFAKLLDFRSDVTDFLEQPLQLEFTHEGKIHTYTPDFLAAVRYTPDRQKWCTPILYEIKPLAVLKKRFSELRPKFSAAFKFCASKKWRFRVVTESDIHSNFLDNAKFLLSYKYKNVDPELINEVTDILHVLETGTPMEILVTASTDEVRRAKLLYAIWHLVATENVVCDLHSTLAMDTPMQLAPKRIKRILRKEYETTFNQSRRNRQL